MVHGAESVRFLNSTADVPCAIVELNAVRMTGSREGDAVTERRYEFVWERGPQSDKGYFSLLNCSKYDVLMFREEKYWALSLAGPTQQFFHKWSER